MRRVPCRKCGTPTRSLSKACGGCRLEAPPIPELAYLEEDEGLLSELPEEDVLQCEADTRRALDAFQRRTGLSIED